MASRQNSFSGGAANEEISDEKRKTLFVMGISEQVDEEILYEMFINVRN